MSGRRALLAILPVLAAACVRIGAYQCDGDDEACADRSGGRCEPTGYCSYPDPSCPSGARYSRFAGPYAEACTADDGGGTSTSVSITTGTSSTSTSSSSTSSTTGDDGSSTGGPQPGEVLWQFTYDGGAGDDAFNTVAVLGEVFVVGGAQTVVGQGDDALVIAYEAPEVPMWTVVHDFAGGLDQIDDLVISSSAEVFVTGEHSPIPGEYDGWAGCFRMEGGTPCWMLDEVTTGGFAGRGIAHTSDSLVVVAGQQTAASGAFVEARHDWNQQAWAHVVADAQLLTAVAVGDRMYVAGTRADGLYLASAELGGVVELAALPGPSAGPDAIQHLATDGVSIVAAGWVTSLTSRDGWLARFDLEGEKVWEEIEGDDALDEEIEGVAIADDGTIYAVGFVTSLGADSWVASWDPAGELDWSRDDLPLGTGHDIARDVVVTDAGILVVGESTGADGELDGFAMLLAR